MNPIDDDLHFAPAIMRVTSCTPSEAIETLDLMAERAPDLDALSPRQFRELAEHCLTQARLAADAAHPLSDSLVRLMAELHDPDRPREPRGVNP